MSQEGVEHLTDALNEKIDYFRKEYELTYAEVIGLLDIIKMELWSEASEQEDEDEA